MWLQPTNLGHQTSPFISYSMSRRPSSSSHLVLWFTELSLQVFNCSHCLLPTLGMVLTYPGLELLRQDGQELLEHQELQDLLLGMCVRPQPLMTEFPKPAQCFSGTRSLLVTKVGFQRVGHDCATNPFTLLSSYSCVLTTGRRSRGLEENYALNK